jgi:hypothetical protein
MPAAVFAFDDFAEVGFGDDELAPAGTFDFVRH